MDEMAVGRRAGKLVVCARPDNTRETRRNEESERSITCQNGARMASVRFKITSNSPLQIAFCRYFF
jgi:hypothetical protein